MASFMGPEAPRHVRASWSASLLADLPLESQVALFSARNERLVSAGQVTYQGKDRSSDLPLFLVTGGLMRVFVASATGREVTVRFGRPGDLIGIPASIAGGSPMGVQSLTAGSLLVLPGLLLRDLANRDIAVAARLNRALASVVFEVSQVLADNVFQSVTERVSGALLALADRGGTTSIVRAGSQDLADQIGSVREVVSRTLRQLRESGLIDQEGPRITLLDEGALRQLATSVSH